MTLENIQAAILETLKLVQESSGRTWENPPLTCKPVLDVEGFDSLCSIEASVLVEEKLGCGELEKGSLFISEDGTQALTIAETAKRIQNLINNKKEKK